MSAVILRWPVLLRRPIELVVAQGRIRQLTQERDELVGRVAALQTKLSAAEDRNVELLRELGVIRGHRAKLANAVRNRSNLGPPPELLDLIEEEDLAQ